MKNTTNCQNCGHPLQADEKYCPSCGQKNTVRIKPLFPFLKDLVDGILQLDNRFFRSVIPFLFKPGFLTNAYIQGKCQTYIPPLRLYLMWSFIYFYIFSSEVKRITHVEDINISNKSFLMQKAEDAEYKIHAFDSVLSDSTQHIQNVLDTIQLHLSSEDSADFAEMKSAIDTTTVRVELLYESFDFKKLVELTSQDSLSESAILDSLKVEKTYLNKLIVKQVQRLSNATPRELVNSLLDQLPTYLLLTLPIFAFLLHILYFKQKRYYVEHFIFTLHLQSFIFFIQTINMLIIMVIEREYASFRVTFMFAVMTIYGYMSLRNVYQNSPFRTILKSIFLMISYFIALLLTVMIAVPLSILLF